jgi:hypothetical protein
MAALLTADETDRFVADVVDRALAGDAEALKTLQRPHVLETLKETLEAYAVLVAV